MQGIVEVLSPPADVTIRCEAHNGRIGSIEGRKEGSSGSGTQLSTAAARTRREIATATDAAARGAIAICVTWSAGSGGGTVNLGLRLWKAACISAE